MFNVEPSVEKSDLRYPLLKAWLCDVLDASAALQPLAGDASFRRYFRVNCGDKNYIAMDAPPDREDCHPFVAIAKAFHALGLSVPMIHEFNAQQGFLLLSDLGDRLFLDVLNAETADALYQQAIDDLLVIQSCRDVPGHVLPYFDEALYLREMRLFQEWYLAKWHGVVLSSDQQAVLDDIYRRLIQKAQSQPEVCVHLDYHSRNLMVLQSGQTGILDFQDAREGPITYDLVSLLRDCYIDWPADQVERWALLYQKKALEAGLLQEEDAQQFLEWFDWMGVQRHLKCMGIFVRLKLRDKKPDYLQYIPRITRYIRDVCERTPELSGLLPFLKD